MKRVDGAITYENTTDMLLTYSEEEKQENEINKANAHHIFAPQFIPYYPSIKAEYSLSDIDTLLYGFIHFYMSNSSGRFYFTNEQLAELLNTSIVTISRSIKTLQQKQLLICSYRIKAGGGQIRFISDIKKTYVPTLSFDKSDLKKLNGNYNKISNNKINRETASLKSLRLVGTMNYLTNIPLEDVVELRSVSTASERQIREKGEILLDYCVAKGKRYKNYKAFLKNAVRRDYPKRSDFDEVGKLF